jgi:hypothetical protein
MIATDSRRWPAEGLTRVPYWVYSDPGIYAEEQAASRLRFHFVQAACAGLSRRRPKVSPARKFRLEQ